MSKLNYFLFPHMVLSELEFRHLAVLLPRLGLLQVCREPHIPEWGDGLIYAKPTISQEQVTQTNLLLKEFHNFASLLGGTSLLTSKRHFTEDRIWQESRFRIQSYLKGKDEEKVTGGSRLAELEASVFLEMAYDLDQQGVELQSSIARAENLQKEFLQILGITGEEDREESIDLGDWHLPTESNYMSFMLGKRLGFWLRLFVNSAGEEKPILVAVIPEVLTEIVDPLINFGDPVDKHSFEIFRTSLTSISCLDNFDGAEFSEIIKSLRDSDALTSYWQSLAMVLTNPKDLSAIEKLNEEIEKLENLLADYSREEAAIGRRQSRLSLVSGSSLTIGDLWKRFDKSCGEIKVSDAILDQPVLVILYGRESFH